MLGAMISCLQLSFFVYSPAKRAERGWQNHSRDSPMEQTNNKGEAVGANKGSTAQRTKEQ